MTTVGISYGIAASAYGLLGLWLWRRRGSVKSSPALIVACFTTMIWALAYASGHAGLPFGMIELQRNAGWFFFLLTLLNLVRRDGGRWPVYIFAYCLVVLALHLLLVLGWIRPSGVLLLLLGPPAALMQMVLAMLLLEQLYRNTQPDQRWGIKFMCLGLLGLFVFDFYMFAEAVLFNSVDPALFQARGLINALAVPLIAWSVSRNPGLVVRLSMSRRALFHSASLLAAGIYLLLMAAAGYYIRYFGGDWGGIFQTVFLFGAALILVLVMFSGTMRAYMRVFLSKHFFAYRYDYREEWLRFTRSLSEGEPGVHLREHTIRAIATLVECPAGALWLRGEKQAYECVAHWNMSSASGVEALDSLFCLFLEKKEWVIDIEEFDRLPESYGGLPALPEWLLAIPAARYVVPLVLHDRLIGWVLLSSSRANLQLNWEVNDLLKTAGRQAAGYLAQLEAAEALLVARQFESFNRMSAFVIHDLKNVVAQLSLLLANAARHKNNPAFQEDMLETIGHAIDKMNRLLMQLRKGAQPIDAPQGVALDVILARVLEAKELAMPRPVLGECEKDLLVHADSDRLERVVGHLVQNAVDACSSSGHVTLALSRTGGAAEIRVVDDGVGMSEQFIRERLFRPFESTKNMGMGIGTYESREYVRQLGGEILVESREGVGTSFVVRLPLQQNSKSISPASGEDKRNNP